MTAKKTAKAADTKAKPKKLTVKQIENLKAGQVTCFETTCVGKTCSSGKSEQQCDGKKRRSFKVSE